MAEFLCRNWKSSICFERNLTPRSEMFVSQSKLKRTLTFDSVHRFLFKNFSFDQSSVNFQFSFPFFCLKERKSFIPHFNGKFPALDRSMCFFSPKTPLLTKVQWISMQDVAQIGFFFFFTKKKILFIAGFRGKFPAADFWTKLDTSCLDYTFNFLFFSSTSTSFERSRLHRVLRNCGSADRGTSENSVNMQICSCWALGEIEWFAWKWTFPFSVFKMLGLVLNKHKLTPLKWLFFGIV